ncbi:MAG TPA: SWIM zinc finger family protein [Bacteroidia bacterium]|nr:SWIM zinc finger family protein [Bacteroidia bacterium]
MAYVYLHDFRNELDESILERGYYYFKNDWLKKITEIMPGCFEAVIEEVNPHAVTYTLADDGKISNVFCTCGDKEHIYCRHLATVLFHYEFLASGENRPATMEDMER